MMKPAQSIDSYTVRSQTRSMNESAPRRRDKIIGIALVSVIVGAAVGTYLFFYLPQTGKMVRHGFAVESNRVVLVKLPGFNYSAFGIWRLQLDNAGNTTDYAVYSIRMNGYIAGGNSSALPPGQRSNITTCMLLPFAKLPTFEVAIFLANSSGTFSANYPVTIQNATQTQYSGQFSVANGLSASAYNSEFKRNVSTWSITVSNLGTKAIDFAYVELWNSTTFLSVFQVLCAGQSYLNNYGQPLPPGQSASGTRTLFAPRSTVTAGKTYKVDAVAVYSDFSEVIQTYDIRATA